jgi:putative oxidoreductase
MNIRTLFLHAVVAPTRWLDLLQSPLALATRWYVSWQFLKSGWLKLTDWNTTLDLFRSEYHVPVLPPSLAAVTGTLGELLFPVLLVLGLGGRIGALGLFAVNLMAVVSYSHVLLAEGFEAALGQHLLWGFMLAVLAVHGNGALSLDRLLMRRQQRAPSGMSMV